MKQITEEVKKKELFKTTRKIEKHMRQEINLWLRWKMRIQWPPARSQRADLTK